MDEVEGWWITANVRRVPMSACRVEDRFFNLCGELCIMENEMKIHSQLDETKLKLDSSSLYNEVDPTGPRPAPSVSSRSLAVLGFLLFIMGGWVHGQGEEDGSDPADRGFCSPLTGACRPEKKWDLKGRNHCFPYNFEVCTIISC
jgi:hypothetical protein